MSVSRTSFRWTLAGLRPKVEAGIRTLGGLGFQTADLLELLRKDVGSDTPNLRAYVTQSLTRLKDSGYVVNVGHGKWQTTHLFPKKKMQENEDNLTPLEAHNYQGADLENLVALMRDKVPCFGTFREKSARCARCLLAAHCEDEYWDRAAVVSAMIPRESDNPLSTEILRKMQDAMIGKQGTAPPLWGLFITTGLGGYYNPDVVGMLLSPTQAQWGMGYTPLIVIYGKGAVPVDHGYRVLTEELGIPKDDPILRRAIRKSIEIFKQVHENLTTPKSDETKANLRSSYIALLESLGA